MRQPSRRTDSQFRRAAELHRNGNLKEAIELYESVLAADEHLAEVHTNLAVALQAVGRVPHAIIHYERALTLQPDSAYTLDNYGSLLQKRGEYAVALKYHERAVKLDPRMPQAHHNLGNALLMLRQPQAAIEELKRALELHAQFPAALNCLGAAYQAIGSLDEAIENHRKAIAISPRYPEALSNLGHALRDAGQISEAIEAYEKAVASQPRAGRFHRFLIEARGNKASPDEIRYLEDLLRENSPELTVDDRLQIHFGLGKAYDTQDDIERAFVHLRDGNAIARLLCKYNEPVHLHEMELLTQLFNKTLLGALAGNGDPSDAPVFIFGMPRSGTTLVEQILAAHPQVFAGGEIGAVMDVMHHFPKIDADPTAVETFREAFITQLRRLGARYVEILRSFSPSALRITDKWPWSFKFLGIIHLILPNARLIHVRREPADTCLSCFSTVFTDDLPYMYDQGELGRYYRAYEKAMDYWRDALPPGRIFEIQYEALVEDFENEARRLVGHCELEWNDACLQFWTARRPVRTASAVAVRQPLQRRPLGRAQAYGAHLAPLIAGLKG